MRILVVSGHPDLDSASTANCRILNKLSETNLDLNIRRLDQTNKGFNVDVAVEQEALLDADLVVLQTPMYWYSVPALLKNWIDQVFTYGFAYGKTGNKLKGKGFMMSMTISSPFGCYQTLGYNNFTVGELLNPLKQTALMSQMIYQEPVLSYGVLYFPGIVGTAEGIHDLADDHYERLVGRLTEIDRSGISHPTYSKAW